MSPAGKKGVLIGGALAVIAIVVAAFVLLNGEGTTAAAPDTGSGTSPTAAEPSDPTSAARTYLLAFAKKDPDAASKATDAPMDASAALQDAWATLRPKELTAKLGDVGAAQGDKATAGYTITWNLGTGHVWTYTGSLGLVQAQGAWRVHWAPTVLHPKLETGQRLAIASSDVPAVVDRDGKPLVVSGGGGLKLADDKAFPLLRSALTGHGQASQAFAVERVDASGKNLEALFGNPEGDRKPAATGLSIATQNAAQAAVDGYRGKAVLVAIQPSSGDLLAVAQNGSVTNAASAFSGQYAPGSTFKIVTATAALEAGLVTPDSSVPCPLTDRIGTRTLSNEGFDLGTTTVHKAFAKSCNTTFGRLASQLPADGLAKAATQFGLNADFGIEGLSSEMGRVDPAASPDEQVEDGIGQGKVQVSPMGAAVMAATAASGHAVVPRLWEGGTKVNTGYQPPSGSVLAALRGMMREVVTGGTATGLAHSGSVFGKTGTAQFGSGAEAHGWFVGYRGDLAFAVFLEGANDSKPAVSLGAKFLDAL
ncbi:MULTISPECIES: penicillin-binding transpeptidase domain-containing protein [Amycolatopsis]|uniref:Penicillin-binding protein n=1 Tax=Amycolatopsis dendrobii TaxID=2760662 RepID=A0A7W3ZD12_9PSEU|nr:MULTISPECIES: penicillin-binding transpeptidase domain-containing protein [Amycolatopsis]MBB1156404.1 penicillin-binding protein [Amycolatopsis dendrobii]UKD58919.1 penicillin-binding protein [Amycolatopsis sp. FU40]